VVSPRDGGWVAGEPGADSAEGQVGGVGDVAFVDAWDDAAWHTPLSANGVEPGEVGEFVPGVDGTDEINGVDEEIRCVGHRVVSDGFGMVLGLGWVWFFGWCFFGFKAGATASVQRAGRFRPLLRSFLSFLGGHSCVTPEVLQCHPWNA